MTTKPNEQDPTSQDKLPRKGVEGGKAKRSGPAAGKSTRKTAKGKAKSVDPTPAPGSSSEPVPGEESDRRDRREFLDDHHALTREALGELEVRLAVANAARNKEPTCKYQTGLLDVTNITQMILERPIATPGRNSTISTDVCHL